MNLTSRTRLPAYDAVRTGVVTAEPIDLPTARAQCRVDLYGSPPASPDDFWLTNVGIPGARAGCEGWLGASVAQQTIRLYGSKFSTSPIELPFGPVQSITSITYFDVDDAQQTVDSANYVLNTAPRLALLTAAADTPWPTTNGAPDSVVIEYVAGYLAPTASPPPVVPTGITTGMLLLLAHLYRNREGTTSLANMQELPFGVTFFLEPFRRRLSMA